MAWKTATEVLVGSDGQVYTAPVGTALPTTADAALNAAFVGHGYHAESGVTFQRIFEITEFKAWQALRTIRRERQTEDVQISFELLQWNEETVPFAFGGGDISTVSTGQFRYDPPADRDTIEERSLICDVDDGDRRVRLIIPRGSITEGTETQFQRTEMGTLKVTFKSLEPSQSESPYRLLFNDDVAFAAGS